MRRLGAHALRLGASPGLLLLAACGPDGADAPSFEDAAYAYVADDLPWIATIDGAHERVTDSAPAVVLDWAPDGRLAWLEASDGSKIQAWVADDRSIRLVAAFHPPSTGPRHLLALRWSPVGDALAGLYGGPSSLSHDAEVNEFFVVDLQEPEPTRARDIGNPGGEGFPPVWSPDGDAVIGLAWVFDSNPDDDRPGLFLHDLVTDEVRIPAIGQVRGTHPPAWSPDGQRIAFATPRDGTLDIHVADSPDADSTALLDGPCDELNPRWTSNGDTLLVRQYCSDAAPQDLVIDADTGAILSTITGLPAWAELSPDGTRALWTETVPGQHDGDIVVYDLATEHVVERIRGRDPRWRPPLGDP